MNKIKVFIYILCFIIGFLFNQIVQRNNEIETLTEQNAEMYGQLILTKDQLKMIEARNEAIKYMEENAE